MKRLSFVALVIVLFGMIMAITVLKTNYERKMYMGDATHTLKTYTGVGSGVYKHGTIVKVVDGQPVVVGHFDDDSGAEYPGTVQIEEVK